MEKTISLFNTSFFTDIYNKNNLSDIPTNTICTVKSINASGLLRNRMLDIGIIPGTEIKVIRRSSNNDIAAYLIRGAVIALRKKEASLINVNIINQQGEYHGAY